MQQLVFHPAWDKALAEKDRKHIIQTFETTRPLGENSIQISVLRHAFNYKEELLVTGIIHNLTEEAYSPHNEPIIYVQNGREIAKHVFTIPDLTVHGKTSTPWTFIFPKEQRTESVLSGHVGSLLVGHKRG